ncbi:MAG: mersacidin/lichenicidin family type 2 lantibiotic [Acidobacteriota bacterium]
MKKIDIARALRDPEYRATLSAAEQAALPTPAGVSTLADESLQSVTGGCGWTACNTCPFGTTPDFSCVPPGHQCP